MRQRGGHPGKKEARTERKMGFVMEGKQDKQENCTICKLQPLFRTRISTDIYPGTLSVTRTKHSMSVLRQ